MSELLTPRQLVELVTSRPGYTSAVGTEVVFVEPGRVHRRFASVPICCNSMVFSTVE